MSINVRPRIVTNGLILHLDAANIKSYPNSGIVWNDLSGNQYNGTLANGPSFNKVNAGNFTFDGTNDYLVTTASLTLSDFTITVWSNLTSLNKEWIPILEFISGSALRAHFYVQGDLNTYTNERRGFGANFTPNGTTEYSSWNSSSLFKVTTDTWYMFTGRVSGSSGDTFINNQKSKNTINVSYTNVGVTNILNARIVGSLYGPEKVANIMIYNKALTENEIQQNYNAQKTRFGLT